jgi:hypothetical protein
VVPQIKVLEDHADLGSQLGQSPVAEVGVDPLAIEHQGAGLVALQLVDDAQQRALAGARWADQADHLAFVDAQVDALEHRDIAIALLDRGEF